MKESPAAEAGDSSKLPADAVDKGGRPSKYRRSYAGQVKALCLLGATNEQIAEFLGVHLDTVHHWRRTKPDFANAIRDGKTVADTKVAAALFKRATGFKYDEVTFELIDSKGVAEMTSAGEIKRTEAYRKKVVTKYVAPDTAECGVWLRNRAGDRWRSTSDLDKMINSLDDAQLEYIIAELLRRSKTTPSQDKNEDNGSDD